MVKKKTSRAEKNRRRHLRKLKGPSSDIEKLRTNRRIGRFPTVRYVSTNGSDILFVRVKEIIEGLIQTNELPDDLRRAMERFAAGLPPLGDLDHAQTFLRFGQVVYDTLMKSLLSTVQWGDDVSVDPDPSVKGSILVTLKSLEKLKSHEFSSPLRPVVSIDSNKYRVIYLQHTIDRIATRLAFDKKSYIDWGLIAGVLHKTVYFEVVRVKEQVMICLWDRCDPTTGIGKVHLELAGDLAIPGAIKGILPLLCTIGGEVFYYRLGYCPIRIDAERKLVVLKTLLLPGMDGTPEWFAHESQLKTIHERRDFQQQVLMTERSRLTDPGNFEIIRRLHKAIPQVKVIKERVFAEDIVLDPVTVRRHFRQFDSF